MRIPEEQAMSQKAMDRVEQWMEAGFLVSKMPAHTDLAQVLEHYRQIEENPDLPSDAKILIDCSSSNFDFQPSDIQEIIAALDRCLDRCEHMAEAIVVAKPYETAIASIFQRRAIRDDYDFQVFSTVPAGIRWLLELPKK